MTCVALAMLLAGFTAPAAAEVDFLSAGAEISGCQSALLVGPHSCVERERRAAGVPEGLSDGNAKDLESRIDDYLANYGKPPRAAIRALLEPTDSNIRDLVHINQEKLAVAAYVAARMTVLQGSEAPSSVPSPVDPAAFSQMRLSLFMRIRETAVDPAVRVLRELAVQVPSLPIGVILVGNISGSDMRGAIARIGPPLTVDFTAANSFDADRLPFLRIEDLRSRRALEIDALELADLEQLRRQIATLRERSADDPPGHGAAARDRSGQ